MKNPITKFCKWYLGKKGYECLHPDEVITPENSLAQAAYFLGKSMAHTDEPLEVIKYEK